MNVSGKDIFWLGLTGIAGYVLYRVINFGDSIAEAASSVWDGVTFDPSTMGPPAQLTKGAQLAQADWIAKGYLEFVEAGRQPFGYTPTTRITPAGEAYIQRQRERDITGRVVN